MFGTNEGAFNYSKERVGVQLLYFSENARKKPIKAVSEFN